MKYFVIFLLCCVAFSAAAPQLLTTAGFTGFTGTWPGVVPAYGRTVVAGPTVVNGFGARYITPGVVGYY